MTEPFLSIVLATYNRAHLLPRAIGSVLAQDYLDWELLIVDDGSTDNTIKTVRDFTDRDPRIQILINPHQGLALTRNSGIRKVRGEYVTFLDSDDEYMEGHLRLHTELLRKNTSIEMLHGKVTVIGEPYVPDARDLTKKIHVEECTQPGTFFIKRDLLLEVGGFPVVSFGEDSALLALLQQKRSHVILSPHRTYRYYNTEPDSMCNTLMRKIAAQNKGS